MSVTLSVPASTTTPIAPARRPWLLLLPVILGVALYLLSFVLRYSMDKVPANLLMPTMMAAMWGPLGATMLLGLLWLIVGPPAS
jgi:hypothetical protein